MTARAAAPSLRAVTFSPPPFDPRPPLIPAPSEPADIPAWRDDLAVWRTRTRDSLGYTGHLYDRADLAWTSRAFCCGFVMVYDQRFYDPATGRVTLDKMLDRAAEDFGGYDAIVLWHAYPRIGFDDRNQFDVYRDLPGGLDGVRAMAEACHARGVRMLLNYNPWDTGTRREPLPDLPALVDLIGTVEADGLFLDTMRQGAAEFRAALDARRPGVALEPEADLPVECLHDHHLSWAQWFRDSPAPGVLRTKWFERRHMLHQIRRWDRDHTGELHTAWMNGAGILHWENVFGSWNGWCPRDRSILRLMLPVQRRFADHFVSEDWTPLVPTLAPDLHASEWAHAGTRLWTVVNRAATIHHGPALRVARPPGEVFLDLMAGRRIPPESQAEETTLALEIPARGLGGVLALPEENLTQDLMDFLAEQEARRQRFDPSTRFPDRPVVRMPQDSGTDRRFPRRPVAAVPPQRDLRARSASAIMVPEQNVVMRSRFRNRECGTYTNTPFVDRVPPMEEFGRLVTHEEAVRMGPVAVASRCVTNAEFLAFLGATGYRPADPPRFLDHWTDGRPRPEDLERPVVYVDLADARAYAAHHGLRLPTEHEWQRAAELAPDYTEFVGAEAVWNLTESEHSDGITRFVILKGGADYVAAGSIWYPDGGRQPPDFSAKFLLGNPGLDRCRTVGFRCAADLA